MKTYAFLFVIMMSVCAQSSIPRSQPSSILGVGSVSGTTSGLTSGSNSESASEKNSVTPDVPVLRAPSQGIREKLKLKATQADRSKSATLLFDLPVTYNYRVSQWIKHYQGKGKVWFSEWLERASIYMPFIQKRLKDQGLPQDLAYMVMIESGFEPNAVSSAKAVGPWQFIEGTGSRYGLHSSTWLDERRDLHKSTIAATGYLRDLYREFGSWYLVAASYNMGEGGLARQIQKYKTRDFWELSRIGAIPQETIDYVPKILAAMMIAKSPALYGFETPSHFDSFEFDTANVPGGTDLRDLADFLGLTHKSLADLNAELILGYVPRHIDKYMIRVPKGSLSLVSQFLQKIR